MRINKTFELMNSKLHIIGSGSALPTKDNFPSSQILELRDKQFMIDCGEGTQIRLKQMKLKTNRLGHIFISHLHGDHCLGLVGMISTFGMLNRTADLHIHSHPDLERLLEPQLKYFCAESPFKIFFHPVNPTVNTLIYEDRSVEVYSIPLKHHVLCCGFLFKEKSTPRHIKRDMLDFYNVPIAQINKIKNGEDFITEDGETIPNAILTSDPSPPFSYAYCSDTAYNEDIIPIIKNVDILFHEATFADDEMLRARQTMHSTAHQAATIAKKANVKKLIIGHYSARYANKNILLNEAKDIFENTILSQDMMTVEC
ncbi:MAG: ribonuclease Z [Paludibacteraceae bacterium]